ncbi:hypothetical protein MUO79_01830 [Candidatus Bathyarchaeota archaeon]|nr:hypothetical protein [Candidatus Bathyarchaeota archaeon]
MKLSEKHKELLINEIGTVREKMAKEKDPRRKIFFYSAIPAMIDRLYNLEYHPELILMHIVFTVSYNAINMRVNLVASGDPTVQLPSDFFDNLDKLLSQMQDKIAKGESIYSILEKLATLSYLTSGNGYYLSQKGVEVFSP